MVSEGGWAGECGQRDSFGKLGEAKQSKRKFGVLVFESFNIGTSNSVF